MERVYNFSAGPSMLPLEVLERAQKELVNCGDTGCSVMEMSHRSPMYEKIIYGAEASLRELMAIPDDYAVLFLQGGASLQFSMVPMNLAKRGQKTCYAVTGQFATKAYKEAQRWTDAVKVTDSSAVNFTEIPAIDEASLPGDAAYLHITGNNTIYGTHYEKAPATGGLPLVADWSSAILGQEINVPDYALIYAGAQKNMSCAGLTVVIVDRKYITSELDALVPSMLRYDLMAKNDSMYNTPPCYAIYIAGLVYDWVKEQGGVSELERVNRRKAALLYDYLDSSEMFTSPVRACDRSIMNVTFTLPDEELTKQFLAMTSERGMINLKGHRSVGGCRASIYNAMPLAGVEKLIDAMSDFEKGKRA